MLLYCSLGLGWLGNEWVRVLALVELLAVCVVYGHALEYVAVLWCNWDFHNCVCKPDRLRDGWLGGHLPSGNWTLLLNIVKVSCGTFGS